MKKLDLFRQKFNQLESIYAAYRKQSNLSNAEYWCLIYIYEGYQKQMEISQHALSVVRPLIQHLGYYRRKI